MSIILPKTCNLGSAHAGLVGTVGVTLCHPDGSTHTARTTNDIYELGVLSGCYGKEITFPDNWTGSILWDSGAPNPVHASEDYDVEGIIDKIEEDTSAATPANIAAAVWDALHIDYQLAGSMGEYLTKTYKAAKKVFIRAGKV